LRAQRRRSTLARVSSGGDEARKKRRPANNLQLFLASVVGAEAEDNGAAPLVGGRLDALLKEAGEQGLHPHDTVKAVMDWAARQGYAEGGYAHARSLVLDSLETVLILDAVRKKTAA